ncbi:MAG TPA: type II toxin-antitoxin system HipA family toxin [Spirochaetia bacterium]|nr:type II toxin-antitoxin system HipA family toxin [Spirochaetia bacterium]
MARPFRKRSLAVWMNGERVGPWSLVGQGRHEFHYVGSWLDSSEARPLSLSLPLAPSSYAYSGAVVEAFFDNLLPDSADIRARIKQRFSAASLAPFDLLAEVGRDCVGAVQLIPEDEEAGDVRRIDGNLLGEADVEGILRGVTTLSGSRGERETPFRISIAGAQEKTALLNQNGRWYEPVATTPTTHILKLPFGRIGLEGVDMSMSIENEWLCSRIASALGFDVATCEIVRFGETKTLVVERFDRRLSSDRRWIARLPQEDFCQATGTSPALKYESDGGPGIPVIMKLLLGARDPLADRRTFLRAQIFSWLLAAPDGHAKNFSVFIERAGRYRLTPLYDIMSAYPVMGHGVGRIAPEKLKMAMAVSSKNKHYEWSKILLRHWRETASVCGIGIEVDEIMTELLGSVPSAMKRATSDLPDDFPDSVASPIFDGIRNAAGSLLEELNSRGRAEA